ncbi:MAG: hypothetical protein ACREE0_17220, partial [Phenylobacterium sp.]
MSVLHLDDPDAIRQPTPKLDRAWMIGFSLIALGGFASGFIQQTFGPLGMQQTPVEAAPPAPVADIQPPPQAPAPSTKPAMQVAAAPPEPSEPVKLEVPD